MKRTYRSIIYYYVRKKDGKITEEENKKYNSLLENTFLTEKIVIKAWNISSSEKRRSESTDIILQESFENYLNLNTKVFFALAIVCILYLVTLEFAKKKQKTQNNNDFETQNQDYTSFVDITKTSD